MIRMRSFVGWTLIVLVPAIVWSMYLYASRITRHFTLLSDYGALAAAVAIGVGGVFLVAGTSRSRLLGTALYVPVQAAGMYVGMVAMTCAMGDCL